MSIIALGPKAIGQLKADHKRQKNTPAPSIAGHGQPAAPALGRHVRIGRTTANGETYPEDGNTFYVEFGSYEFTEEVGLDQDVIFVPYSADSEADAMVRVCLANEYLAEDTIVFCGLYHGQWHIVSAEETKLAAIIEFELEQALTTGDASATAIVLSFDQGSDPDPEDDGLELVNPETAAAGVYRFEGASGVRGTAYLITNGADAGKYRIVQMDCGS